MVLYVDEEFKNLIPPLTDEEYKQLEENILKDGIRDPIVFWGGPLYSIEELIVDGHNRYEIAQKHDLEFQTIELDIILKEDVKLWIINNQFGRRNINNYQRSVLALKMEDIYKARAKETQGTRTDLTSVPIDTKVDSLKEISDIANIGRNTISRVKKIEEEAPEEIKQQLNNGDISINAAFTQITKPHVANNSGENEWYTPPQFIESARFVMGGIDLDPASSELANETVKAPIFYTKETNGLDEMWEGNVWLNPPYAQPLISQFSEAIASKINEYEQAIILVNNATETSWFQSILAVCNAVCFPKGRIKFLDMNGNPSGSPLQGQCILYVGAEAWIFITEFKKYGICMVVTDIGVL